MSKAVCGEGSAGLALPAAGKNCPHRLADLHAGVHDFGYLPRYMPALAGDHTVKEWQR